MKAQTLTRRRAVAAGAAFGAATLGARPALGRQATPAASPAAAAVFPVTIAHVYGETTIEAQPARVVTISWANQDAAIALGVIPVGMPAFPWGGDADGFLPWTREALGDNPPPTLLDESAGLPFEDIAGLKPDLILGVFSGMTQDEYDILSGIAPTVAYPETPFGTSWQDTTTIVGMALGKGAEAGQLVAATEALLANGASDYPQVEGKSFTYGTIIEEPNFNIYTVIDARVQLLSALGMVPSPFVERLDTTGDATYFVPVSFEDAGEIDGDLLIFWFGSQEEADAAAALPAMTGIPAFQNGAYAAIVGQSQVMASSAPSVLSIPYIIDEYVPLIAAAADNVPAA